MLLLKNIVYVCRRYWIFWVHIILDLLNLLSNLRISLRNWLIPTWLKLRNFILYPIVKLSIGWNKDCARFLPQESTSGKCPSSSIKDLLRIYLILLTGIWLLRGFLEMICSEIRSTSRLQFWKNLTKPTNFLIGIWSSEILILWKLHYHDWLPSRLFKGWEIIETNRLKLGRKKQKTWRCWEPLKWQWNNLSNNRTVPSSTPTLVPPKIHLPWLMLNSRQKWVKYHRRRKTKIDKKLPSSNKLMILVGTGYGKTIVMKISG